MTPITDIRAAARRMVDAKTKPVGSLGRLETLAIQLATIQGTVAPVVERMRVVVFAGDHGVAAEGVSLYPPQVTREMMRNYASGGAAINVLARSAGADVEAVDVGVGADLADVPGLVHAKVRLGTRNFAHERALTGDEVQLALEVGAAAVRRAAASGVQAIGLGEMGIANTTSAAALLVLLTTTSVHDAVGRGTGVDDAGLARKREVVTAAVARHTDAARDVRAALAAVGGLEIVAMAGAALEAPAQRMVVVVDGFISTVAMLAAVRINPLVRESLVFSHRSEERGHVAALAALDAHPLLDLGLRLGEGTGAALALPLVRAAARMLTEMATFESAGVSGPA